MDDDRNPLVPTGNVNSESEVEVVFDETANLMASKSFKRGSDKGYGTNSLLEEWRETKQDDDYDPYDNDLYESWNGYLRKRRKTKPKRQTGLGMEKTVKDKAKSKPKSQ
ncbi:hypothetical protein Tco_0794830 [Tanacetum coccineum]